MALPFKLHIEVKGDWAKKVDNDLKNPNPEEKIKRQRTLAKASRVYKKYYTGD